MSEENKPSPVEGIKEQSHFLLGDMDTELVDGLDHFGKTSETLLKFHGTYQQDNRDDREAARELAALISAQGYEVWWDRELVPGDAYADVIEKTLDAAKVVIVLWSAVSRKSYWVRDEAAVGRDRGRLVPIALDGEALLRIFRHHPRDIGRRCAELPLDHRAECADVGPAVLVKRKAGFLWRMTQHQAHEFRDLGVVRHGGLSGMGQTEAVDSLSR